MRKSTAITEMLEQIDAVARSQSRIVSGLSRFEFWPSGGCAAGVVSIFAKIAIGR